MLKIIRALAKAHVTLGVGGVYSRLKEVVKAG